MSVEDLPGSIIILSSVLSLIVICYAIYRYEAAAFMGMVAFAWAVACGLLAVKVLQERSLGAAPGDGSGGGMGYGVVSSSGSSPSRSEISPTDRERVSRFSERSPKDKDPFARMAVIATFLGVMGLIPLALWNIILFRRRGRHLRK